MTRVFQTLVIAIIAMFMISRSEIITFAEKVFLIVQLKVHSTFNTRILSAQHLRLYNFN